MTLVYPLVDTGWIDIGEHAHVVVPKGKAWGSVGFASFTPLLVAVMQAGDSEGAHTFLDPRAINSLSFLQHEGGGQGAGQKV